MQAFAPLSYCADQTDFGKKGIVRLIFGSGTMHIRRIHEGSPSNCLNIAQV